MRSPEYKRLQEEEEIRPNRYAAKVLFIIAIIDVVFFLANECQLIHIEPVYMRASTAISLFFLLLPSWMVKSDQRAADSKCKYYINICVFFATLVITIILNLHATMVFAFPIILATQYHSRKIGFLCVAESMICVFLAPYLAYFFKTWNYVYGGWIMETYYGFGFDVKYMLHVTFAERMMKILIYFCLPNMLIIIAFSVIVQSVLLRAERAYQDQVKIIQIGETDALTGLLNRHSFTTALEEYPKLAKQNLTCIYVDCNGLHNMNNKEGHEKGDQFLIAVANQLTQYFGEENCYRIGGDEFVVFLLDQQYSVIQANIQKLKEQLLKEKYSIASGVYQMGIPCDIKKITRMAEQSMYENKKKYYAKREVRR